jgi:predicted ABC-type ATPase
MNVDRIPDDPVPAAETAGLTEPPETDAPRPTPELERRSPPEQRQPPDREPEPEPESHDEQQEPENEHRPESPTPRNDPDAPAPTDSPDRPTGNTPDTPDTAEPRSRQEHAASTETTNEPSHEESLPSDTEKELRSTEPARNEDASAGEPQDDFQEEDPPESQQLRKELIEPTGPAQDVKDASPTDAANNSAYVSAESSRPLTSQEHAERENDVFDGLVKAHGEDLSTDYAHTTDPDRQQWTPQRDALHGEIVAEIYGRASEVPCEYKALIVGGLGGAGKTTVLNQIPEIELSRFLVINPDDIKEELARRGLVPEIEGLTPMEASDLVHEESSAIAKQLARKAQSDGKNLIWDITMSSEESTQRRIDDLRAAGYTQVDGLFVDIPIETSVKRMELRHREGHDKYRAGIGLGGRFVPPEIIRRQTDSEWGCKNRRTFEAMKKSLNNWAVRDNGTDDRPARLVESSRNEKLHQSS